MDFTITVQRAEEHAASLRRLAVSIDREWMDRAEQELQVITAFLEGKVKEKTPTDTGVTRMSVFSEVQTSGVSLEGIVSSSLPQTPALEFGRKPGKMPPSDALKGWAKRKLGSEKLAFVVARAIGRKGTEGKKMFEDAWKENTGEVSRMLERIGVHVSEELLQKL